MARKVGAAVEGELEAVHGVEDGVGSDQQGELVPLDKCVEFLEQTESMPLLRLSGRPTDL